ncbi:MAG: SDR family NAD(P)-dependent oxidoreductase [Thermodesulfobacteriota bacterium]
MDKRSAPENLKNKSALVLGGIKGIGRQIAADLLSQGCSVAVSYFDWTEELENLKNILNETNGFYSLHNIDLRNTDEIPSFIEDVIKKHKKIDILINNIERGGMPVVHGEYTSQQWDLEQETTLRAKHFIFNSVFPQMKKLKEGCIINISSIAGITGRSGPAGLIFNDGYAAANRGISSFTETWAKMGAPNIRVNELMLGFIETRHGPGTRGWNLLTPKQQQSIIDHTLCKTTGKISDVIKAVNFFIKDAPFATGSVLRIDGGYVLGSDPVPHMPEGVE